MCEVVVEEEEGKSPTMMMDLRMVLAGRELGDTVRFDVHSFR